MRTTSYLQSTVILVVIFLLSPASYGEEKANLRIPTYQSNETLSTKSFASPASFITVIDLEDALDIPSGSVAVASYNGSDLAGFTIFSLPVSEFPTQGDSFLVLSTGQASGATLPNNSGSLSTILNGLNNEQGNDLVQVQLTLNVPAGAEFWAVDWKFFSEEFPEFVGSQFNDAFFIETPSSDINIVGNIPVSDTNIATDLFGSRVSINTTGVTGMTALNAAGTTYDGATGILTTAGRVDEGATQINIIFSVTDLGDSVYDTTVFLDNFRFDDEFIAPPPADPPGDKELIPGGGVDSNAPTVVLTHGLSKKSAFDGAPDSLWIGTNVKQAGALISQDVGSSVNIFHYIWEGGFQAGFTGPTENSYNAADAYVADAGANLAKELLKPENLGPNYTGKIHFIGHSLGTIVNAYAARLFLEKAVGVEEAQFTALDRPDHVKKIPGCIAFPGCDGYDENFFAAIFQDLQIKPSRGLNLLIDNYFSTDGAGVGDETNGINVYNHTELINPNDLDDQIFDDEGLDNNHSGVHQWYRWTMDPNELDDLFAVCDFNTGELINLNPFFDASLNPCNLGWKWSIVRLNPLPFPNTVDQVVAIKANLLPLDDYVDHGCTKSVTGSGSTIIQCVEASSPFGIANVSIPQDAKTLSFQYRFTHIGDGDYAAIYLDNILIWMLAGDSYPGGNEFVNSGLIPIEGLTGERALTVVLYGVNEPNARFEIRNILTSVTQPAIEITVDIKPKDNPNCINSRSKGVVPLAIIGDSDFDVSTIDVTTIQINGISPVKYKHKDVNTDGYTDIIVHFSTQDLNNAGLLVDGNTLTVSGELYDGTPIAGFDSVNLAGGPSCF